MVTGEYGPTAAFSSALCMAGWGWGTRAHVCVCVCGGGGGITVWVCAYVCLGPCVGVLV